MSTEYDEAELSTAKKSAREAFEKHFMLTQDISDASAWFSGLEHTGNVAVACHGAATERARLAAMSENPVTQSEIDSCASTRMELEYDSYKTPRTTDQKIKLVILGAVEGASAVAELCRAREVLPIASRLATSQSALKSLEEESCQILGRALGFPIYCEDQKNFPGTTAADGVCTGPYTSLVLCDMVIARLAESQAQVAEMKEALRFYGDESNYSCRDTGTGRTFQMRNSEIDEDGGAKARLALGKGGDDGNC